ncbi:anti-sigma factor family protein [Nocardia nova]|uniref:anti-sigma factor family protein n=1 Tax=Nocardia nova TaxID=37330 RepID=UPI0033C9F103
MTSADSASPDEYATWDAPYVLGALDQQERLAYEAHLTTCAQCRAEVTELSGLPGLLSRVPAEVAVSLSDEPEPGGSRTAAPVFGDAGFAALLDRVRASEGGADGSSPDGAAGGAAAAGAAGGAAAAGGMLPFEAGRGGEPTEPISGLPAQLPETRESAASVGSESAAPTGTPAPEDTSAPAGTSGPADVPSAPESAARRPAENVTSLDTARERKRSRSGPWLALAGAVAAAAAAVAITIPATIAIHQPENPPATQQATLQRQMDQVVPSPITADFTLTPVDTGTRVVMSCKYATSDTDYTWDGALWVVHTDGTQSMIAQWSAHPGQEITAGGITAVPADQISSVEIRSSTTNQVFLRGTV